jgi:hypothetical protein
MNILALALAVALTTPAKSCDVVKPAHSATVTFVCPNTTGQLNRAYLHSRTPGKPDSDFNIRPALLKKAPEVFVGTGCTVKKEIDILSLTCTAGKKITVFSSSDFKVQ